MKKLKVFFKYFLKYLACERTFYDPFGDLLCALLIILLDPEDLPGSGSQLPLIPVALQLDLTRSIDVTCFTSMVAVWRYLYELLSYINKFH